ncbi:MAG TPA: hypothetical protein VEC39_16685 [Vicinamibacterales bacterium]|nr:hypothetical protein [Vicinamibacterales bacterium]
MLMLLGSLAAPASAQDPPPSAPQPPPAEAAPPIDATKLGVSLSRIQKGLRVAEERQQREGDALRLRFDVQVFGDAPKIDMLQGVDLFYGAVPGTAPTHRDMIEHWTPQIYRTPGLPVSALAMWAAKYFAEKSRKQRCEEEIANYRALIMQGVNVSAPRCTQ